MRPSRIALAAAAALLLGPLAANASVKPVPTYCEIPTKDGSCVRVLYAGQNVPVGRVEVFRENDRVLVVYRVTDPQWTLIETHLYAGSVPPTTNAPGQFPYKHEWINTSVDTYLLTIDDDDCLYVAAHGVVAAVMSRDAPDLTVLASALPSETSLRVASGNTVGVPSYFEATLDGADLLLLDGVYDAWCADKNLTIGESKSYENTAVYSSYEETLPDVLKLKKDNLDLVNWVINQDWVAKNYKAEDVQCALWKLLGFECTAANADAIVNEAAAHEGYLPTTCDARIGLILVPPAAAATAAPQPVLAQVPIAQLGSFCYADYDAAVTETVWACGDTRLRGGWGSYFQCGEDCTASSTPPAGKMKRK